MLDCPISGTGSQAKVKDIVVYASGDASAIRKLKPMFAGFAIGPIFSETWLRSTSSISTEPSCPPLSVTKATSAWPLSRS